jgi:hypothetical protein
MLLKDLALRKYPETLPAIKNTQFLLIGLFCGMLQKNRAIIV